MLYKAHIYGKRLCGRGVQFEELPATVVEECSLDAAKFVDPGDSVMKLMQLEAREGVVRMLRAVTKKAGLTPQQFLQLKPEDWEPVNLQKLRVPGEYSYDAVFGSARDHAALVNLYRSYHVPSKDDIESIVGKAVPVATED